LRCFGWENCIIPHNLKAIQTLIPSWSSLKTLRRKQEIDGDNLRLVSSFFYDAAGPYMPGYNKGQRIADGTYAHVYMGTRGIFKPANDKTTGIVHMKRNTPKEDICIKQITLRITDHERNGTPQTRSVAYDEEMKSILAEAFLHALIYKMFETLGMKQRVPKLYEVIGVTRPQHSPNSPEDFESVWMIMEPLRGKTLDNYLQLRLAPQNYVNNETLLLDIFIQLAYCVNILQTKLRFNHRDMKLNNLFVRYHATNDWDRNITVNGYGPYTCLQDITLLDFGFSCIGCSDRNTSLINAGSWFDENDLCFKQGRDICQFLYSLHTSYPLAQYVSPAFFEVLTTAMTVETSNGPVNILHGVDINGVPYAAEEAPSPLEFHEGIYKFLKNEDVKIPGCEPLKFLASLRDYN